MIITFGVLLVLSAAGGVLADEAQLWTAPAGIKISEDATAPAGAWKADLSASGVQVRLAKDVPQVTLSAARREFAAFQIAFRADVDLSEVKARASALTGPGEIPSKNTTIWREHYVNTNAGRRPDPLSPMKSLDLKAGVTQPLFVEIEVPEDAKPGPYNGLVVVIGKDGLLGHVMVRLKVRDFELPVTPSLRSAFGITESCIARQEKINASGATFEKYRRLYYEMLLSHRISPYSIPADLMTEEGAKYLNDPRLTSFMIPYPEDDAKLKELSDHLRKGGWLKKGYFYVVDEPYTREAFAQIDTHVERLKRLVPDYKLVAPYFRNPDFDENLTVYDMLKDKVNIWCHVTSFYDEKALSERVKAGEEVWNYVCCGPGRPYANFHIDMTAMDHRILFWQEWKYRSQGLLYWSTTYWEPMPTGTDDPWEDMATVKWINKDLYGDGSLLYPGHKVSHYGPLPSLRLKLIRQGMQDYEYFVRAAKVSPEETDRIVDSQVISWTEFQGAPEPLETAKDALAAAAGF